MEILDEHEQSERARAWLKDNASNLLTGIALGVAAVAGWHWWQVQQSAHKLDAAAQFATLVQAVEDKQPDTVAALASALNKDFADTAWNALAALELAKMKVDAADAEGALAALLAVDRKKLAPSLATLFSLRVARVYLMLQQPEQALAVLAEVSDAFGGYVDEARADALAALGRVDEARAAYDKALLLIEVGSPLRDSVEMKRNDLPPETRAGA